VLATTGVSRSVPVDPVVSWQKPGSILLESGFQPGDRIVAVNGQTIEKNRDAYEVFESAVKPAIEAKEPTVELTFDLLRGEEELQASVTLPSPSEDLKGEELANATKMWGTVYGMSAIPVHVVRVHPNFPADNGGMKDGDTVIEMDGKPVLDWAHFAGTIEMRIGEDIPIKVERTVRGEKRVVDLVLRPV